MFEWPPNGLVQRVLGRVDDSPGPPHRRRALARGLRAREEWFGPTTGPVEHYSIADIQLSRLYWALRDDAAPELGIHPNLSVHYKQMIARPAVQRTLEAEERHRLQPATIRSGGSRSPAAAHIARAITVAFRAA
jgi:glutathione S-transferase